jgi:hypothetical protein
MRTRIGNWVQRQYDRTIPIFADLGDVIFQTVVWIPHQAVVFLLWTILWGGCIVSGWMAYRWARYALANLINLHDVAFEELLHGLLHSIELLLLVPLPGIVGAVVYKNLGKFLNPAAVERVSAEREMSMAKRLVLGILVTVAGTRMLDDFLHGTSSLTLFACGAILIISVALYVAIALPDHANHLASSGSHQRRSLGVSVAAGELGSAAEITMTGSIPDGSIQQVDLPSSDEENVRASIAGTDLKEN